MDNKETQIRELNINDINKGLLDYFNRYQEVNKVWRVENNKKVIKDISFTEHWDNDEKEIVINDLKETLITNGTVFGAFEGDKLIGFSSLKGTPLGEREEYLQLYQLHVSTDLRGKGIGKMLFHACMDKARSLKAAKLYISAHSSVESMAFYTRMGCADAKWIYKEQVELEPCDCQMEYIL